MRSANLTNYVNLLNEVYANGLINNDLCRKHKLNVNTYRAMKQLNYADAKGNSLMTQEPTIQDARKIIAKNKQTHNQYKSRTGQTEMKLVVPKTTKVSPRDRDGKDARINLRFTKKQKEMLLTLSEKQNLSVADLILNSLKQPVQK